MCVVPTILSVIAGTTDVISFLGLGFFNAHITGNLVILAAHIVAHGAADLPLILAVPIFIAVLCLMRLLVGRFEALRINSLMLLLLLQLLLLTGFFVLCGILNYPPNPSATVTLVGGQLGVAAMAVQTALVQLLLKGAPSTAVMTTNITLLIMDAGDVLFKAAPAEAFQARWRAKRTWPVILGFTIGATLGAACFAACGLKSLGLSAGLALIALIAGLYAKPNHPA